MKNTVKGMMLVVLVALMGCSGNGGYTLLESGFKYKLVKDVEGRKPERGDIMMIDWISIYDGDSVLANRTAESGFVLNPFRGPEKLLEVLALCDEGDSVHIEMSTMDYALLTRMPIMRWMDSTKRVEVRMNIAEVENESKIIERRSKQRIEAEKEVIRQHLADNGLEAIESPEGIFQVVTVEGDGPKPQTGQQASVRYTCRLLDGTLIDTNREEVAKEGGSYSATGNYKPFTFTVGNDAVIPGWHKAVPLINKGGRATLFFPSFLGYGRRGKPPVRPNTILVFDIEVVDIK